MANENNKKIPCGGFYLGDGLIMDGNTLKSLGGEQVQTDYAQNDSTAKDYIKNRPGGYEEGFEITWDGDTTGRVSITAEGMPYVRYNMTYVWYQVSDEILTSDQVIGGQTVFINNGEAYQKVIADDNVTEAEFGYYVAEFIIVAMKTGVFNFYGKNISISEPGVYFARMDLGSNTAYTSSLSNIITHPFDDKCIPDTIVRKAELDSRITEKEVILTSSTTDSTKKFKITVNDSGTLTATEIPEQEV